MQKQGGSSMSNVGAITEVEQHIMLQGLQHLDQTTNDSVSQSMHSSSTTYSEQLMQTTEQLNATNIIQGVTAA
jgi:hypothetical protein